MNPQLVQALTLLGQIALEEGNLEEARKWLSDSLNKNGEDGHTLFLLATIGIKEKKYLEARHYLEKAIAINPGIPEYYFSLITTYHEIQDYRGALELARQTLQRFPENPDAFFNVAIELTFLDEFEQAKEHFRKTIKVFERYQGPKYTQTFIAAKYKLAHLLLREGSRYEEASRILKEVVELDPNYMDAYLDLARINIRQRQYVSAGHLLERAIALEPQNAGAHYLMARTLSLAGNEREAEREYEKFNALRVTSSGNPQPGMVD
jgi:tetratricopeptide (TPR) repeat protein